MIPPASSGIDSDIEASLRQSEDHPEEIIEALDRALTAAENSGDKEAAFWIRTTLQHLVTDPPEELATPT